jgi:hypothetical protein
MHELCSLAGFQMLNNRWHRQRKSISVLRLWMEVAMATAWQK